MRSRPRLGCTRNQPAQASAAGGPGQALGCRSVVPERLRSMACAPQPRPATGAPKHARADPADLPQGHTACPCQTVDLRDHAGRPAAGAVQDRGTRGTHHRRKMPLMAPATLPVCHGQGSRLDKNPARDLVMAAIPKPPVAHNPFLQIGDLPDLLQALHSYRGTRAVQMGLRLLLLTGVRTDGTLAHPSASCTTFHCRSLPGWRTSCASRSTRISF